MGARTAGASEKCPQCWPEILRGILNRPSDTAFTPGDQGSSLRTSKLFLDSGEGSEYLSWAQGRSCPNYLCNPAPDGLGDAIGFGVRASRGPQVQCTRKSSLHVPRGAFLRA